MATQDPAVAQVRKTIQNIFTQATSSQAGLLSRFSAAQQRRAVVFKAAETKLAEKRGEDDPDVIELRRASTSANLLQSTLKVNSVRSTRLPKLGLHEWMVFGHVTDAAGQPAADLSVRVFDRDRKLDDLLGETTTDDMGDFSVVYHERDFAELREEMPELYVMIEDDAGKLLYSSRESFRPASGRAEYFEIKLGEPPKREQKRKG